VPTWFWRSLFITGHGFWSSLQNVVLGPFLALISFVCSIGNVPIAAALWRGGISFGGVISFVFADLITLPLLLIYRKYFGTRLTLRLLAAFWVAMSAAGLATEYLVRAVHLVPKVGTHIVPLTHAGANYTTVLNVLAAIGFGVLYWLYRSRTAATPRYAKDPVCGMQVEKAVAPARLQLGSQTFYFCSDRCSEKFAAENSHATRS
jgi:YHS domain-containing protein